jgi:deoxyhypusine synthase
MAYKRDNLSDGFGHGLEPVEPIDAARNASVSDLLRACAKTSFGGRQLGEAAATLETMIKDPECFVICTLSGAMTVAKQGLLVCEMVDRGWIQAVVSTGALMAHGLVEGTGRTHFKYDPSMDDEALLAAGYDRVYDTLELEKNLNDVADVLCHVLDQFPEDTTLYSARIMRALGRHLDATIPADARAILKSCYRRNVPVYVPAFTDSELGLNTGVHNQLRLRRGLRRRSFDPFLDLEHYGRLAGNQTRTGILTIGGGVPRNWAQQIGPFLDHLDVEGGTEYPAFRIRYGVRICPEPVHWGGLSGCTYTEGISWGKFVPPREGGRFAEVFADATIVLPFLVRGLIERLGDAPPAKKLKPPSGQDRIRFVDE